MTKAGATRTPSKKQTAKFHQNPSSQNLTQNAKAFCGNQKEIKSRATEGAIELGCQAQTAGGVGAKSELTATAGQQKLGIGR